MQNPTFVLFYVLEAERVMHPFHLGTDEATAKQLTEEKWVWYETHDFEKPFSPTEGRVKAKLVALELERDGKVVLRRDADGWTRAPQ